VRYTTAALECPTAFLCIIASGERLSAMANNDLKEPPVAFYRTLYKLVLIIAKPKAEMSSCSTVHSPVHIVQSMVQSMVQSSVQSLGFAATQIGVYVAALPAMYRV
jgi:hypothetical protein